MRNIAIMGIGAALMASGAVLPRREEGEGMLIIVDEPGIYRPNEDREEARRPAMTMQIANAFELELKPDWPPLVERPRSRTWQRPNQRQRRRDNRRMGRR